jgi:hypothetical protein
LLEPNTVQVAQYKLGLDKNIPGLFNMFKFHMYVMLHCTVHCTVPDVLMDVVYYRSGISIYSDLPAHGEILRLQRHCQIAEISVHYHKIGGGIGGGTASILVKTLCILVKTL